MISQSPRSILEGLRVNQYASLDHSCTLKEAALGSHLQEKKRGWWNILLKRLFIHDDLHASLMITTVLRIIVFTSISVDEQDSKLKPHSRIGISIQSSA